MLSSPEDQLQPKLDSMFYRKPGDVLDLNRPVLFDIESSTAIQIDDDLFPNAYRISSVDWREDDAPSPSSTTSAGTRSTASSRWTRRPARPGP